MSGRPEVLRFALAGLPDSARWAIASALRSLSTLEAATCGASETTKAAALALAAECWTKAAAELRAVATPPRRPRHHPLTRIQEPKP